MYVHLKHDGSLTNISILTMTLGSSNYVETLISTNVAVAWPSTSKYLNVISSEISTASLFLLNYPRVIKFLKIDN